MLPTADAAAVPVTPRELSVGPQRRRNVTVLPVNKLLAVTRVRVPPRRGAGRHVDPSLARKLERLDYSAWLAVGEALPSLADPGVERGDPTTAAAVARGRAAAASADATAVPMTPRELSVGLQRRRNMRVLLVLQRLAVTRVRVTPRRGAGRHVDPSLARELERLDYSAWLAVGEALASLADKVIERGTSAASVRVSACADAAAVAVTPREFSVGL